MIILQPLQSQQWLLYQSSEFLHYKARNLCRTLEVLGLILIWNNLLFYVTPVAILWPYALPSCQKICLIASVWNWHSTAFLFLFSLWWRTKCVFLALALMLFHYFFFFKQKQEALEALFWRRIVTILQYFCSLCFDEPVERKQLSLSFIFICCGLTLPLPRTQSPSPREIWKQ